MESDVLGFLYPTVDTSKCVDCGLCNRVCSFQSPKHRQAGYPITFLMHHKNPNEVTKSKSGAAFVVFSDVILKDGGIVYGAKLNSKHLVEHSAAFNIKERDEFRGSKYIQSNLKNVFLEIKGYLKNNKKVLFSGTPCQVAGLKSYIGAKLAENLFLIDILCHGVASPSVWIDYLKQIESTKGKRINKCIPRNPQYGWDHNIDTFIFEDDSQYNSDFFTGYVYHKWITQRWSCGVCPFTTLNRVSDITLGDAWGIDKVAPALDRENKGCSLVLINTEKGNRLFEAASADMISLPVDIKKMIQPVMLHPTILHHKRQAFETAYAARGYNYVRHRYLNNTIAVIMAALRRSLSKTKQLIVR